MHSLERQRPSVGRVRILQSIMGGNSVPKISMALFEKTVSRTNYRSNI